MKIDQITIFIFSPWLFISLHGLMASPNEQRQPTPQELVRDAVRALIKMQEDNGSWYYSWTSGGRETHPGYQVANTSIVAQTLLLAAPEDKKTQTAIQRGLAFILKQLDDPSMSPRTGHHMDNCPLAICRTAAQRSWT